MHGSKLLRLVLGAAVLLHLSQEAETFYLLLHAGLPRCFMEEVGSGADIVTVHYGHPQQGRVSAAARAAAGVVLEWRVVDDADVEVFSKETSAAPSSFYFIADSSTRDDRRFGSYTICVTPRPSGGSAVQPDGAPLEVAIDHADRHLVMSLSQGEPSAADKAITLVQVVEMREKLQDLVAVMEDCKVQSQSMLVSSKRFLVTVDGTSQMITFFTAATCVTSGVAFAAVYWHLRAFLYEKKFV
eukprot:TRINITY_DN20137_c0_g1_i1.p1 TRINITY_DN20137_c0_g1~~TRINITY_DN20137_c0_g1_i1.p1  ORF type:complete len:242 (+),score=68.62 TRINITY_DN20137_c0_g1_i1:147-872(+)